jgi:hypothetical protein
MTRVEPADPAAARRMKLVVATGAVLIFLGVSAVAGGIALTFGVPATARPPDTWLRAVPLIDSWTIPGLVLGVAFGLGSLVTAYGVLRRPRWTALAGPERVTAHHWSWIATILLGAGQIVWIGLELVYLPGLSFLEFLYGCVGVILVLLAMIPPVKQHLSVRTPAPPAD